eukprot:symbB.v1.2.005738.t1/scaffold307.1/size232847/3
MKRALGDETLAIGQVVLRYWSAPHSCAGHKDHQAFGTAVLDLTPVNGSGLWVQCGSNEESSVGGAFFVPLHPGDVAVHGWDVVHGVHVKDGHERMSLVIWTSPAEDLKSGLCSWYLAEALQAEDLVDAAYALGVEAWRQRMLGETQLQLLQQTLEDTLPPMTRGDAVSPVEMLSALGGARHAVEWQQRCQKAMRDIKDLKAEAEALKKGDAMKALGQGFNRTTGSHVAVTMRGALRRGWDHARQSSEEMRNKRWSYAQLGARTADLANATRTLTQHGLAIFEDPTDQVDVDILHRMQKAFGNTWGDVLPNLQRRSQDIFHGTFQFREVCSRSMGRVDIRLGAEGPDVMLPWMSFVHAALGDAKEVSRGVLLSSYGSNRQQWHRDSEHLFQTQLPLHAMTIFTPLVEDLTSSMGFPSFIPGSHTWHHQADHFGTVTPVTTWKSWLAFDNRILHRGEANLDHLQKRDRPLLYFVYAKPWFQDVRNFPVDAPSLFDELETGSFFTV